MSTKPGRVRNSRCVWGQKQSPGDTQSYCRALITLVPNKTEFAEEDIARLATQAAERMVVRVDEMRQAKALDIAAVRVVVDQARGGGLVHTLSKVQGVAILTRLAQAVRTCCVSPGMLAYRTDLVVGESKVMCFEILCGIVAHGAGTTDGIHPFCTLLRGEG